MVAEKAKLGCEKSVVTISPLRVRGLNPPASILHLEMIKYEFTFHVLVDYG